MVKVLPKDLHVYHLIYSKIIYTCVHFVWIPEGESFLQAEPLLCIQYCVGVQRLVF